MFFLKYALWVPPTNPLNTVRLVLWLLVGAPAVREYYEFIEVRSWAAGLLPKKRHPHALRAAQRSKTMQMGVILQQSRVVSPRSVWPAVCVVPAGQQRQPGGCRRLQILQAGHVCVAGMCGGCCWWCCCLGSCETICAHALIRALAVLQLLRCCCWVHNRC